jgi:hypothetical protein
VKKIFTLVLGMTSIGGFVEAISTAAQADAAFGFTLLWGARLPVPRLSCPPDARHAGVRFDRLG